MHPPRAPLAMRSRAAVVRPMRTWRRIAQRFAGGVALPIGYSMLECRLAGSGARCAASRMTEHGARNRCGSPSVIHATLLVARGPLARRNVVARGRTEAPWQARESQRRSSVSDVIADAGCARRHASITELRAD